MKQLNILCQERYKFIANPEQYLRDYLIKERDAALSKLTAVFRKKKIREDYERNVKNIKKDVNKYVQKAYVYYKGSQVAVPNDFYVDYKTPDVDAFLEYLEAEYERKHIITDEDREKARILDCNLDYNYLQTLINKVNKNPDLRVTIRTNDGATIILDNYKQLDKDEEFSDIVIDRPTLVK